MSRAIASALLLAGSVLAYAPVPSDGYELRGPALPKGTVLLVTDKMHCQYEGGFNHTIDKTFRVEVLAVKGRDITKQRIAWEKYLHHSGPDGAVGTSRPNPLTGRAALFEKAAGWSATLEKVTGDDRLTGERPWSTDDVYYPTRRVKVGDSWDVPEAELKEHLQHTANIRADVAKARMRFVRLAEVSGQRCAEVEMTMSIKGRYRDHALALEMNTKLVSFRSLRHGLDLKTRSEGDFAQGTGDSKMTGRQVCEYTLTIEKKP
jgi:hypothetical protein